MKNVTIKDIAKKAGLTHQAVSYILKHQERLAGQKNADRVLKLVEQLDYQPNYMASSLRSGKKLCIGVAGTSSLAETGDLAVSRIYAGIGEVADQHRNTMIILPAALDRFHDMVFKATKGNMVDGVILLAYTDQYENIKRKTIPRLQEYGTPFTIIHFTTEKFDCPNVGFDMPQGGYLATRHLVEQGYRDIACINSIGIYNNEYLAGYHKACEEAQVAPVIYTSGKYHYSAEHGFAFGNGLARDKVRHRAYTVFNDQFAYGFIKALQDAGQQVPRDAAVTGCGNLITQKYQYSDLTTIDLKYEERGRRGAEMLFEQIEKKTAEKDHYLAEPELIVRISSSPSRIDDRGPKTE